MTIASAPNRFLDNLRDALRQMPWMTPVTLLFTTLATDWLTQALRAAQWKNPFLIGLGIGLMLVNLGILHQTSMRLIGAPPTVRSFWRYGATILLLFLPLFSALILILLSRATAIGGLTFAVILLMIPTAIFAPMLLGWPLLQATSQGVIGIREAFRRSEGVRWSLLLFAFCIGSASHLSLPSSWTENVLIGTAAFAFALAIEVFGRVATIAMGVAAYRHSIGE